jgi:hypothetical protein
VARAYHVDKEGAIRGEGVTFDGTRAGLRCCDLQDVVIPSGLGLKVLARVNRVIVLAAGTMPIEKGLIGAFIHKTARDDDNAVLVVNRHGSSLNDGLTSEVALGRHSVQVPFSALWSRAKAENEKESVVKVANVWVFMVFVCILRPLRDRQRDRTGPPVSEP